MPSTRDIRRRIKSVKNTRQITKAMELVADLVTKEPAPALVNAVMEAARERGLLIGKGGAYGNCIRISPPLNIARSATAILAPGGGMTCARTHSLIFVWL